MDEYLTPSRITCDIYISGIVPALDAEMLYKLGIKSVLRVNEIPLTRETIVDYNRYGIQYNDVSMLDIPSFNIGAYFDKTNYIIHNAPKPILVHCTAGISRSVTVVAAYLLWLNWNRYRMVPPISETLSFIRHFRTCAHPNPGFVNALNRYREKLLRIC